eukprot:SAG22_NODE_7678_length_718_cov_0.752827_2_plen_30_part_01
MGEPGPGDGTHINAAAAGRRGSRLSSGPDR